MNLDRVAQTAPAVDWCGTLNNFTTEECDVLETFMEEECKWGIIGKESGESGTLHLQFALRLKKKKRFGQLRSVLGRAHWEKMKGTLEQNRVYCSKDGVFREYGEIPMDNGKREKKRWGEIRKAAMDGRFDEIDDQTFVTHYPGLRAINKDFMSPLPDLQGEFRNLWIWGETGCGKSVLARKICNEGYTIPGNNLRIEPGAFYRKRCDKWWDAYQQQPYVIIDDWSPRHAQGELEDLFKDWTDRYALTAEIKCGAIAIRPQVIIVTSQYSLENCFTDPKTVDALKRRFNFIHLGPEPGASAPLFTVPPTPPKLERQAQVAPSAPKADPESRKRQKEVVEIEEGDTEEEEEENDVDPDDEDPDIIVTEHQRKTYHVAAKLWKQEYENGLDGMENRGYRMMVTASHTGNPLAKDWLMQWRYNQTSQKIQKDQ